MFHLHNTFWKLLSVPGVVPVLPEQIAGSFDLQDIPQRELYPVDQDRLIQFGIHIPTDTGDRLVLASQAVCFMVFIAAGLIASSFIL